MFTFGIFTTHLPYIAFVLFYGFFFLAGIEKASAGEFGESQQIIQKDISVSIDYLSDDDDSGIKDYKLSPKEPELLQLLFYEKQAGLLFFDIGFLKEFDCRFSWFSRPPPGVYSIF